MGSSIFGDECADENDGGVSQTALEIVKELESAERVDDEEDEDAEEHPGAEIDSEKGTETETGYPSSESEDKDTNASVIESSNRRLTRAHWATSKPRTILSTRSLLANYAEPAGPGETLEEFKARTENVQDKQDRLLAEKIKVNVVVLAPAVPGAY
ncbi:hypothetical protein IAT38_008019 [Cryptococcus sp. DSM 104549]